MNSVVLQDADGSDLGFMLCSNDLGEPSGDCVFMALPGISGALNSPAAALLFERRNAGESSWEVVGRTPLCVVVRSPGLSAELFVELDGPDGGKWGVGNGPARRVVGRAKDPKSA